MGKEKEGKEEESKRQKIKKPNRRYFLRWEYFSRFLKIIFSLFFLSYPFFSLKLSKEKKMKVMKLKRGEKIKRILKETGLVVPIGLSNGPSLSAFY